MQAETKADNGSAVADALRAQLVELVTKGDPKKDGALTAEILARVVRVAKTGRDLLLSLNASPSELAAIATRKSGIGGFIGGFNENMGGIGDLEDTPVGLPLVSSPPAENFGMTAIREIVAALKSTNALGGGETPLKLVEALAAARAAGLHDVAKELERRLGVLKTVAVAPAEAAPANGGIKA